ncbi:MAG: hypothetical protein A2X25_11205 [Chloroflexi bacterium GWB2_49_20]|nr:MAG: hypothetical protein A2X25_11205 [Chloroflexi bacterium GWB2_49_20]OGN78882.1 MAG: hypothetical protein A2X26_00150 [Chloroflexi bacterium GWC2_49_37]OGN86357.1 MAG: hypothetical protein A2X27_05630 [Chloroflexi bacterium GWD2_49_16]HBG74591.1 hypothetical protein [Anaerolineae bacterium]
MKIATNHKLIKRNSRIGQITSLTALGILAAGMYITFKMPDKVGYSLAALLFGFFLSQIGMYYGNRWGRSPRPDEVLDKSLKGLGRDYTIYHYSAPTPHLLVGPSGLWVLLHFYQGGTINYGNKRWRQKGGGFIQSYLKMFGQENIGRPDVEGAAEVITLKKFFKKTLPEIEIPEIYTAAIFSNPNVDLSAKDSPIPALTPKDFKEFIKQKAKDNPFPQLALKAIQDVLPHPDSESKKD